MRFITVILAAITFSANAQSYPPFAPVGAEWNYSQTMLGGGGGMTTVSISSQVTGTTFAGIHYSQIGGFYAYRDSL